MRRFPEPASRVSCRIKWNGHAQQQLDWFTIFRLRRSGALLYSRRGRLPLKLRALLDFAAPRLRERLLSTDAALAKPTKPGTGASALCDVACRA